MIFALGELVFEVIVGDLDEIQQHAALTPDTDWLVRVWPVTRQSSMRWPPSNTLAQPDVLGLTAALASTIAPESRTAERRLEWTPARSTHR
jgi:hypothetical protein